MATYPVEGALVEVAAGDHAGKIGKVLKVTGSSPSDRRWRVETPDGKSIWVDSVRASDGEPSGAAVARLASQGSRASISGPPRRSEPPPPAPRRASTGSMAVGGQASDKDYPHEGAMVEITKAASSGLVGAKGKVLKVTGSSVSDRRWRVEMADGKTAWADDVRLLAAATAAAPAAAAAPAIRPSYSQKEYPTEGDFVIATEGANAMVVGARARVLKVLGDSAADRRWKLELLDFDGTTAIATGVRFDESAPAVPPPAPKDYPDEGASVMIMQANNAAMVGKRGKVVKVVGESAADRQWRVELAGGGAAWASAVEPAPEEPSPVPAAASKPRTSQGAMKKAPAGQASAAAPAAASKPVKTSVTFRDVSPSTSLATQPQPGALVNPFPAAPAWGEPQPVPVRTAVSGGTSHLHPLQASWDQLVQLCCGSSAGS